MNAGNVWEYVMKFVWKQKQKRNKVRKRRLSRNRNGEETTLVNGENCHGNSKCFEWSAENSEQTERGHRDSPQCFLRMRDQVWRKKTGKSDKQTASFLFVGSAAGLQVYLRKSQCSEYHTMRKLRFTIVERSWQHLGGPPVLGWCLSSLIYYTNGKRNTWQSCWFLSVHLQCRLSSRLCSWSRNLNVSTVSHSFPKPLPQAEQRRQCRAG